MRGATTMRQRACASSRSTSSSCVQRATGSITADRYARVSSKRSGRQGIGRISEADSARLDRPSAPLALTGQKISGLARQAGTLYRGQDPTEQRRLLDTVLSNCTFDRGGLSPTRRFQ